MALLGWWEVLRGCRAVLLGVEVLKRLWLDHPQERFGAVSGGGGWCYWGGGHY